MAIRYLSGVNIDSNTLFVDDVNNRVGVGTGSPAYTLDIATSSSPTVRITRNGATDLRLGASIIGTGALIGTYSNSPMSFLTNSVVQAVITEAGNVGIGTTSPSYKLQVNGAMYQSGTNFTSFYDGAVRFGGTNGYTTIITNAGNVGIGTTAPGAYLEVKGDTSSNDVVGIFTGTGQYGSSIHLNATGTSGSNWRILSTANGSAPGGGFFGLYNDSVGLYRFVISPTGNVGIGTTSPGYKLDVTGDINFTSTLKFGGVNVIHGTFADIYANIRVIRNASTSVSDGMYIGYDNSGGASGHLRFFANGTNERMRIDASTGNVGIGTTSPAQKLTVSGSTGDILGITNGTTTGYGYVDNNGFGLFTSSGAGGTGIYYRTANIIDHYVNGSIAMRLNSTGNVGIGTTSPSGRLEVSGGSGATGVQSYFSTGAGYTAPAAGNAAFPGGAKIILWNDTSTPQKASIGMDGSADIWFNNAGGQAGAGFTFYTGDGASATPSARLKITKSGNVGIGTTSPSALLNVAGSVTIGSSSVSTVNLYLTRTNGGVVADANYFVSANNTPNQTWIEGGYYTGELAGVVTSPNSGYPYIETYAGQGSATAKSFGFVNKTSGSFISTDFLYTMALLRTGQIRFHQYGSGSFTGTVAYNLAVDSSGNIIETAGGVVDGSGTANYITRWIDGNTVGNSAIYQSPSGGIGIHNTTPTKALEVGGSIVVGMDNPAPFWNALFKDYSDGSGLYISSVNGGGGKYIAGNAYYYNSTLWRSDKTVASAINLDNGTVVFYTNSGLTANTDFTPTERMRITSAGNVGIGTTSPAYKLDVAGDLRSTGNIRSNNGTVDNILSWTSEPAGVVGTLSNHPETFWTNSTERMRITSAGNVGIGVTNPDSYNGGGNQLVIGGGAFRGLTIAGTTEGNIYFADGTNGTETYRGSIGYNHTSDYLYFYSAANERLRITSAGNVGIGTTSPVNKLSVLGLNSAPATSGTGSNGQLRLGATDSTVVLDMGVQQSSAYSWIQSRERDAYASNYKLSLNPNGGNVGIGTTSPSQKLHVNGVIEAGPVSTAGGPMIYQSYASPNYIGSIGSEYSSGAMLIGYGATGKNGASGYVSTFDNFNGIRGLIKLQNGEFSILSSISAVQTSVGGDLTMTTNFIVTNAGNVGIGTTAPTSKLHVASGRIEIDNGQSLSSRTSGGGNLFPLIQMSSNEITVGGWEGSHMSNLNLRGGNGAVLADFSQGNASFFAVRGVAGATPNEYMRVTSTGNVGIGTTSPLSKLHVQAPNLGTSAGDQTYAALFEAGNGNSSLLEIKDVRTDAGSDWTGTGKRIQMRIDSTYMGYIQFNGNSNNYGISFGTGGTTTAPGNVNEKMRITSAGNVGIGTTSPAQKLDISQGSLFLSGAGSKYLYIRRYDGLGTHSFGVGSDEKLILSLSGGNPFIVDGGNVGIGTTSPAQKLHVDGKIYAKPYLPVVLSGSGDPYYGTNLTLATDIGQTQGAVRIWSRYNSGGTATMTFEISSTDQAYNQDPQLLTYSEKMRITSAGNVGIGTTNPAKILTVAAISSTWAGAPQVAFYDTISGEIDARNWTVGAISTNYGNFTIASSTAAGGDPTTPRLTINKDGNVGIGTTSPGYLLDVNGSGRIGSGIGTGVYVGNTSHAVWTRAGGTNGNMALYSGGSDRITIVGDNGNVGIGTTSPANTLHTYGASGSTIAIDAGGANNSGLQFKNQGTLAAAITYVPGTSQMHFYRGGDVMVVGSSNVGIGTTSPSQRLHVSGNVRVTGAYYDSNNSAGSSGQVLSSTGSGTDWVSLSEITGVDGTGTANYIAKWSDTDTITNSQIRDDGTTVGVGQAPAAAKMSVNGALNVGGRYLYNNFQSSLDTTGVAVAGLYASTNGDSAFFTFEAGASNGQYQRIVWSCYNAAGTWNVVKVIDEGTNAFDVVASASSGATITFTWKSRSGILYFTPRLIITGVGSINTSYL